MTDVLSLIVNKIKTAINKVELENATKDTKTPYTVLNFPTSDDGVSDDDGSINYIFEVDAYDKGKDNTQLENLVDSIDSVLNGKKGIESTFFYRIRRLNRLMIPEEDKNLRRRQLRYQLIIQERS